MEYIEHGDLSRFMAGGAAFSEAEAQDIMSQLTEGVYFMHSNGFAHRDLKPAVRLAPSTGHDGAGTNQDRTSLSCNHAQTGGSRLAISASASA
jgi:hypothetical protein